MHKLYVRSNNTINMFHSTSAVTTFLLLAMMFAGLLIMNGNFLVYAQELQYFPTAITIPILPSSPSQQQQFSETTQSIPPPSPQTYYQQSPSPPPLPLPPLPSSSPIQNVQLTQQITVEICSNGIDDDRDGIIDEVGCTTTTITVEICSNGIDDDRDGIIDEVGCTTTTITVEICSNGIDDDRDGIIDEVGCSFQQQQQPFQQQQIFPPPTPIIPIIPRPPVQQQQPSPISQCEIYTLSVGGSSNLARVKKSLDGKTDLTFEISSILNPYHASVRFNDLISGKLYIDKDKNTEKELNFHVKKITNDCKVIAYLDEDVVRIQDDDDDDDHH
jgi:hypothetical protein